MTCFWDGLMSRLTSQEIEKHLGTVRGHADFINLLKARSQMSNINDVLWNNAQLSPKIIQETQEWIESYNVNGIGSGHDCSSCDPFLILCCHIFRINILHDYNGHIVTYTHIGANRTLSFKSDRGHFW
jgi:hypothetical protein